MKRIILPAIVFILAFALCACGGDSTATENNKVQESAAPTAAKTEPTAAKTDEPAAARTEPAAQTASPQPQISDEPEGEGRGDVITDEPEGEGRGDIFEEAIPDGAEVISQGVYYYDLYNNPVDYSDELSPREGAEQVDALLTLPDIALYTDNGGIPAGQCVYIYLDGISYEAETEHEYYIYNVGIGTPEGGPLGDDCTALYIVYVYYNGDGAFLRHDFTQEYTDDVSQGDPGDTGQPEWWGAFAGQDFNQNYAINITEVSDESFYFEILDISVDWVIYTGTAFLTAIDPYAAEYNAETFMQFYLSDDGISIELTAEDDRLSGYYRITNPNERYELGGRGDIVPDESGQGDIFEASDPGDGGMLGWEGTFDNGEYAIEITNFDGLNFDFMVYLPSNGSIYAEGQMTLYPDNPLMGEWDGMSFSLYEDFSAIDIFAPEEDTYTFLRGQYIRE